MFCSILNAIFKVININFGKKILAWVSLHTMSCSPESLKKIGAGLVVLPLRGEKPNLK